MGNNAAINIVLASFILLGTVHYSAAAEAPHIIPCEGDPSLTLKAMLKNPTQAYNKAPKGFTVDNHSYTYVVTRTSHSFPLPTDDAESQKWSANLIAPYSDLAICRVKSPDGEWWLASRALDKSLSYVPEKDTEPKKKYQEEVKKENANRTIINGDSNGQ